MITTLIATFTRPDTYRGHNRIDHANIPVGLLCYINDCRPERDAGYRINGELVRNSYDVVSTNYRGETIWRYHYGTREEANDCVRAFLTHDKDWKRFK